MVAGIAGERRVHETSYETCELLGRAPLLARLREALVDRRRVVLRGAPGGGKSAIGRWVVRTMGGTMVDVSAGALPRDTRGPLWVLDQTEGQCESIAHWAHASVEGPVLMLTRELAHLSGWVHLDLEPLGREALETIITSHDVTVDSASAFIRDLEGNPLLAHLAADAIRTGAGSAEDPLRTWLPELPLPHGLCASGGSLDALTARTLDLLSPVQRSLAASVAWLDDSFSTEDAAALVGSRDPTVRFDAAALARAGVLIVDGTRYQMPRVFRMVLTRSEHWPECGTLSERLLRHSAHRVAEELTRAPTGLGSGGPVGGLSRQRLEAALALASTRNEPLTTARLSIAVARVAIQRGMAEHASNLLKLALARVHDLGERPDTEGAIAMVHEAQVDTLLRMGDIDGAQAIIDRRQAALDEHRGRVRTLRLRAELAYDRGAHDEGLTLLNEAFEALDAIEVAVERENEEAVLASARCYFALDMGDPATTRAYGARALALAERHGNARLVAVNWGNLGVAALLDLDLETARRCFENALNRQIAIGDELGASVSLTNLACVALEREDYDVAESRLLRGQSLLGSSGLSASRCVNAVTLALVRYERGDRLGARISIERALDCEPAPPRTRALALALRAIVEAEEGRTAAAEHEIELARQLVKNDRSAHASTVELFAKGVALQAARAKHDERAIARTIDALETVVADPRAIVGFTEGRVALRAIRRWLSAPELPIAAEESMEIGGDGRWFRRGSAEPVRLEKRKSLVGILAAMVSAHTRDPESSLDIWALAEAGWPGEAMSAVSSSKRVHTALWTLRTLGLRQTIEHDGHGYRLAPSGSLRIVPVSNGPHTSLSPG